MKFLAATSSTNKNGIEDIFLQSNPVLESFGNAKTRRNNNSSRFGKYAKVYFQENQIIGASTTTYLLEKTRFIYQEQGEGNFHIVYQVLKDQLESEANDRTLTPFHYVTHPESRDLTSKTDVTGEENHNDLQHTLFAMEKLGFSPENLTSVTDLLRGLLALGNIDQKAVSDRKQLEQFCTYLSLPVDLAHDTFFVKTIQVGNEKIQKPLSQEEAIATRDTFSKAVYESMFKWIVEKINVATKPPDSKIHNTIGILDIFGFEVFQTNGFEQFCINYANEKLQGLFNDQLITAQQKEYTEEGIQWSQIDFTGNELCLTEINKYFFPLIDETSRLQSGGDNTFGSRFKREAGTSGKCKTLWFPKSDPPSVFQISHFAGDVEYTIQGFCDRNVDRIHPSLSKLLETSDNRDIQVLSKHIPVPVVSSLAFKSVSKQFSQGLANLITDLRSTDIHYIRCIKPNDCDEADNFNHLRVTEQLRYSGVLEAVRVSRAGYPIRFLHNQFQARYQLNKDPTGDTVGIKKGKSKYFLKHHSYVELEKELFAIKNCFAIKIQSHIRKYNQRVRFYRTRLLIVRLQSYLRRFSCQRKLTRHRCARSIQSVYRTYRQRVRYWILLTSIKKIQYIYRSYQFSINNASCIITRCCRRVCSIKNRYKRQRAIYVLQIFWRKANVLRKQSHQLLQKTRREKDLLTQKLAEEESLRKQQEQDLKLANEALLREKQEAQEKIEKFKQESIQKLARAKEKADQLLLEIKQKTQEEKSRADDLKMKLQQSEQEIQAQNANLKRTGQTKVEILSQMEDVVQENDRMRNELEFYRQVWEKNQLDNSDPQKCLLQ
jgi:myosin-5